MPHLTLEYSSNLAGFDAGRTLAALNRTLADSGQFEEIDIKSRALAFDHYAIGTTGQEARAFAHIKLAILSGRSDETKLALSQALLQTLQSCSPAPKGLHVQLCAEILEIERASYSKAAITA